MVRLQSVSAPQPRAGPGKTDRALISGRGGSRVGKAARTLHPGRGGLVTSRMIHTGIDNFRIGEPT